MAARGANHSPAAPVQPAHHQQTRGDDEASRLAVGRRALLLSAACAKKRPRPVIAGKCRKPTDAVYSGAITPVAGIQDAQLRDVAIGRIPARRRCSPSAPSACLTGQRVGRPAIHRPGGSQIRPTTCWTTLAPYHRPGTAPEQALGRYRARLARVRVDCVGEARTSAEGAP